MKVICSHKQLCEMKDLCDAAKPHSNANCRACPLQPDAYCKPVEEANSTFGFYRHDGDFQVICSINNTDDLLTAAQFQRLTQEVLEFLAESTGEVVVVRNCQVMPDYLEDANG